MRIVGCCVAMLLTACSSPSARAVDTAAVLMQADPQAHATLTVAVSEMLKGGKVTLPNDALLHDSSLTVERARARTATGQLFNGRILERPEQFQLIKEGKQCVLVHPRSGQRKVLPSLLECRAL